MPCCAAVQCDESHSWHNLSWEITNSYSDNYEPFPFTMLGPGAASVVVIRWRRVDALPSDTWKYIYYSAPATLDCTCTPDCTPCLLSVCSDDSMPANYRYHANHRFANAIAKLQIVTCSLQSGHKFAVDNKVLLPIHFKPHNKSIQLSIGEKVSQLGVCTFRLINKLHSAGI